MLTVFRDIRTLLCAHCHISNDYTTAKTISYHTILKKFKPLLFLNQSSELCYRIAGMFGRGKLINLASNQQFAKLKSSILVVTINTFGPFYLFAKLFFGKILIHLLSPNVIFTKLSCFMVTHSYSTTTTAKVNMSLHCLILTMQPVSCFPYPNATIM